MSGFGPLRAASIAALLSLTAATPVIAEPSCPSMIGPLDDRQTGERIGELERVLDREERNLTTYRVGWASAFAIAALGQVGLAELVGEPRDVAIYVSAFKATLGAAVTPFLSPRFELPEPKPGQPPCARLAVLEETLRYAAHRERRGVALYQHGLGLALNVAGLLYLGLFEDQWLEGLAGALIGSAVGELRLWTQPRRAIRAVDSAKQERGPWITAYPLGLGGGVIVRF